jgi:hypothetical protein
MSQIQNISRQLIPFIEKRRILFINSSFNRNKKWLNQSIRFDALLYLRKPIAVVYKIAFQITCIAIK